MAAALFFGGVRALLGKEDPNKKQTTPGVAVTMIVIATLLAVFTLFVLPILIAI